MKSLYVKILLCCLITLLLSLAGFFVISMFVARPAVGPRGLIADIHAWQTSEAVDAYESGGPAGLNAYMTKLRRFLKERHLLPKESLIGFVVSLSIPGF